MSIAYLGLYLRVNIYKGNVNYYSNIIGNFFNCKKD